MSYRNLTKTEKSKITKLFEAEGFTLHVDTDPEIIAISTGLFFTIPLTEEDERNAVTHLLPNHFKPNYGYRSVSVFSNYITSHIRGTYRAYRGRNTSTDYDTANIFSFVKGEDNPIENTKQWLKMYKNLEYNRS